MIFVVHGLPKLMDYHGQLGGIEDPFGLGPQASLLAAILAEAVCPIFIVLGWGARIACLPIIAVLAVAMLFVHPDWSVAEGQFGWLLLIIFITVALCGPGRWRLGARAPGDERSIS